jgi:hypothetical protein
MTDMQNHSVFSDVLAAHGAPDFMSFSKPIVTKFCIPNHDGVAAQHITISKSLQNFCCINLSKFTFNNPIYIGHSVLLILNVLSALFSSTFLLHIQLHLTSRCEMILYL